MLNLVCLINKHTVYKVQKIFKKVCKIIWFQIVVLRGRCFGFALISLTVVKICDRGMEYLNGPTSQALCQAAHVASATVFSIAVVSSQENVDLENSTLCTV